MAILRDHSHNFSNKLFQYLKHLVLLSIQKLSILVKKCFMKMFVQTIYIEGTHLHFPKSYLAVIIVSHCLLAIKEK